MSNNDYVLDIIKTDSDIRRKLCSEDINWFAITYLNHYFTYKLEDFHRQILEAVCEESQRKLFLAAFRGSGKTTLTSVVGALWMLLGEPQKKYVIMISLTKPQAVEHFGNIKRELETNELLIRDFGPFKTSDAKWQDDLIEIPRLGLKIVAKSRGESIRGALHDGSRPDFILIDDVDDFESTKSREIRDSTIEWFFREVVPLVDVGARIIVTGNIVHEDCFLIRMEDEIGNNSKFGRILKFPFFNEDSKALWKSKFSTQELIEDLRASMPDARVWESEYMLQPVTAQYRIVQKDWIKTYFSTPSISSNDYYNTVMAIDPAISKEPTSDNTAMVAAHVFHHGDSWQVYVLPNPINGKFDSDELQREATFMYNHLEGKRKKVLIEESGFQQMISTQLGHKIPDVQSVSHKGIAKPDRLGSVANLIKNGTLMFPETGCEVLIKQLTDFGFTRYDDLADALAYILIYISDLMNKPNNDPISVRCIGLRPSIL